MRNCSVYGCNLVKAENLCVSFKYSSKIFIAFNSYTFLCSYDASSCKVDDTPTCSINDKSLIYMCWIGNISVTLHNVNAFLLNRISHIDTSARTVFCIIDAHMCSPVRIMQLSFFILCNQLLQLHIFFKMQLMCFIQLLVLNIYCFCFKWLDLTTIICMLPQVMMIRIIGCIINAHLFDF